MRESRTYGSVRGALSNGRPYRVSYCLLRCMSSLVADFVAQVGEEQFTSKKAQQSKSGPLGSLINIALRRLILLNQYCSRGCGKSFCNNIGTSRRSAGCIEFPNLRQFPECCGSPRIDGVDGLSRH